MTSSHAREEIPEFTLEEYFDLDRDSDRKTEFLHGQILMMSGGTMDHSAIAANVIASLDPYLRRRGCRSYTSDLKVAAGPDAIFYPDVSVVCGAPRPMPGHPDVLLNPVLVVEVLSPRTETYDRKTKVPLYGRIESLRECLLIAQDKPRVEIHRRRPGGGWSMETVSGLESEVFLPSLDSAIPLSEIFRDLSG